MGWGSTLARIGGYLGYAVPGIGPVLGQITSGIGEGIAQGIDNKGALDKQQAQLQAGTDKAARTAGDVYAQQRADTQNLFGQPYQTLGGLMGLNIAPIGAPMGNVPTTAAPTGHPAGLQPATQPLQVWPGVPGTPSDLVPFRPGESPATLAQLNQLSSGGAQARSASSYGRGRAVV